MKHGRYSLKKFDGVIHDNDLALTILTNYLEQFNPVTPTEVSLVPASSSTNNSVSSKRNISSIRP